MSLRQQNASVGASAAFLLGNPVLNPFTIVFIALVLSWQLAALRLIIGVLLVFGVAWYANRIAGDAPAPRVPDVEKSPIEDPAKTPAALGLSWLRALWWEVYTIVPGYVLIVLVLGASRAFLFQPGLTLGGSSGLGATVAIAAVGTLFAIPTAAEVPIVQTLMHYGLGLAPAAALLVTLPAISLPTLWIVRAAFQRRVLVYLTVSAFVAGVLAGAVALFTIRT